MSKLDLWNRAADEMDKDRDPRWHTVAGWLRAEAVLWTDAEPLIDQINYAYEDKTGIKGFLRFGRRPDGEIATQFDTNEGATAVALAYLGEQPSRDEQPPVPSDQNPV